MQHHFQKLFKFLYIILNIYKDSNKKLKYNLNNQMFCTLCLIKVLRSKSALIFNRFGFLSLKYISDLYFILL